MCSIHQVSENVEKIIIIMANVENVHLLRVAKYSSLDMFLISLISFSYSLICK
jgi:hypothetical protein